jgi:predicted CoA-binding protein
MKKTVVIGASENPERYSFLAVEKLKKYGHPVVAVGRKSGQIGDTEILTGQPSIEAVDTVTLYINPELQVQMEDYILSMKPKRIVFNPGTENSDLAKKAGSLGIETQEACTLVLLGTGQY